MTRIRFGATTAALAVLVAPLLLAAALAAPAQAHAVLVGSSPSDGARLDREPSQVRLTFDETVGLVPAAVKVIDIAGHRVDTGHPTRTRDGATVVIGLRPGLANGSYAAIWRVVSADTHVVSGSIRFGIGVAPSGPAPPGPPDHTAALDVIAGIAQGAVYFGLVLGFGVAVAARWVWPWTRRRPPVPALQLLGWLSVLVGSLVTLALMGPREDNIGWSGVARLTGFGAAASSHAGIVILVRLALLAAAGLFAGCGKARWSLGAGLGVVVTVALTGHASVGPTAWLATAAAVGHLGAMAIWLGGLVVAATVVLPRLRRLARVPPRYLAPWSRLAYSCVAVIIVTGEYMALRQIQPVASLWSTHYGVVLLIKLALVAAMLVAALVAQRRLGLGSAGYGDIARSPAPRFGAVARSVGIETVLAAGVLIATTVLVSEPPARTTYGPAVTARAPLGPDTAHIHVDTTRRGREAITVQVVDGTGTPVPVPSITAQLSSTEAGIAALAVTLHRDRTDTTRWHSSDAVVPLPGEWTLTLTVNLPGDQAYVTAARYPVW